MSEPTSPDACDPRPVELLTIEELIAELQKRTTRLLIAYELPAKVNDACVLACVRWRGTAIEALGLCEWSRRRIYDLEKPRSECC